MKKWKILETHTLFKNQWFDVKEHKVQVSDVLAVEGVITLEFPDWVNIVALDKSKNVILERNYRHGQMILSVETPSGSMEASDVSAEEAARRELLEETGYAAQSFVYLGKSSANAQLQNNWIHHFIALDCQAVQNPRPELEGEVESWLEPLEKVMERVQKGEIHNSYIVEGLLRAQLYLNTKPFNTDDSRTGGW